MTGVYGSHVQRRRRLWGIIGASAVLCVAAACGTAAFAAPRWLRRNVAERAQARGLVVEVADVRLHWSTIELRGVSLRLEGVEAIRAVVGEVLVPWSLGGVGDPTVRSARLVANGEVGAIRDQLDAWRARRAATSARAPSSATRRVHVEGLDVDWRGSSDEFAHASATNATWDGDSIVIVGLGGEATYRGMHAIGEHGTLTVARGEAPVRAFHLERLQLERVKAEAGEAPSGLAPNAANGMTPTLWGRVSGLKDKVTSALKPFVVGADLRVDQLTLSSSTVSVGPWALRVLVGAEASSVEVEPGTQVTQGALSLRAMVPRAGGKIGAELKFGPASLKDLGVREGSLGLSGLEKTNAEIRGAVELDPDAQTLAADGSIAIHGATVTDARLADAPLQGLDLRARGILASKGELTSWTLSGGSFELGKLRIDVDGGVETYLDAKGSRAGTRVWGGWTVPETACNDAFASLPRALLPNLDGLELTGTFGANGRLTLDTRALEKTDLDFVLDQRCRVSKAPSLLDAERFRRPFDVKVYDPKGNARTATFGPGAGGWTPLSSISPYVIDAVLTCEDGAFFSHNGFSYGAIRNALLANVKAGKFLLGASTVTMQLAKNLFLDRRKLASRKLQEALLTVWLEQAVGKNGILELYLNVIEFGPNLYGIGPASWHYFGRSPAQLDPLEATFLISLLPSPVKKHGMYERGAVGPGYLAYLRMLLKAEHARGRIDDDELAEALDHELVFHKPGDPPPAPHGKLKPHDDKEKAPSDDAFDPSLAPPEE
jgi:hypothetical protein